jgi:hypothetical protein
MLLSTLDWQCAAEPLSAAARGAVSASTVAPSTTTPSAVALSPTALGRRLFRSMKMKWLSQTLIDDKRPELGSWLSESNTSPWGIGCRVCRSAVDKLPVADRGRCKWIAFSISGLSVKWCNISRHAASPIHALAVRALHAADNQQSSDPRAAPPTEDFKRALNHKKDGHSYTSMSDVAGRSKAAMLTWCLAESLKNRERMFLRRALCIAIHQDARAGVLLVRFTAVDCHLNRLEGVFGIARDFGTKSKDVFCATMQILRDFCTYHLDPPSSVDQSACRFDASLYEHIKNHIELFDADAASDEQRVGRLLRGKSTVDRLECLPNIKMIMRDRAHAATRSGLQTHTSVKRQLHCTHDTGSAHANPTRMHCQANAESLGCRQLLD